MIEAHIRKRFYAWGDHAIYVHMMIKYLPSEALKVWLEKPMEHMNRTFKAVMMLIGTGTNLAAPHFIREQLASEAHSRRLLNDYDYDVLLKLIEDDRP